MKPDTAWSLLVCFGLIATASITAVNFRDINRLNSRLSYYERVGYSYSNRFVTTNVVDAYPDEVWTNYNGEVLQVKELKARQKYSLMVSNVEVMWTNYHAITAADKARERREMDAIFDEHGTDPKAWSRTNVVIYDPANDEFHIYRMVDWLRSGPSAAHTFGPGKNLQESLKPHHP